MLYQFKGSNGKVELYENKIVIVRNAFSTFPRGTKEIYLKNLSGVQIKKPGLGLTTAGYIQFIFSGSKEIKSKKTINSFQDENTVVFYMQGYQNALVLKQKIEDLLNKQNISTTQLPSGQTISKADELLKYKQLLDLGAITEEEFNFQKNNLLNVEKFDTESSTENFSADSTQNESILKDKLENTVNIPKKQNKKFIILGVIILLILIGIVSSSSESSVTESTKTTTTNVILTLDDIENWYDKQTPNVSKDLIEYANFVDGLTYLNINDSKFLFGGDWNDCYYKFSFTCTVNKENYIGEARAFLKYKDSNINWFSFEIFDNSGGIQSLVEHYDDSYDKIIEDYYKELENLYN